MLYEFNKLLTPHSRSLTPESRIKLELGERESDCDSGHDLYGRLMVIKPFTPRRSLSFLSVSSLLYVNKINWTNKIVTSLSFPSPLSLSRSHPAYSKRVTVNRLFIQKSGFVFVCQPLIHILYGFCARHKIWFIGKVLNAMSPSLSLALMLATKSHSNSIPIPN
jgi:hypothetical protein